MNTTTKDIDFEPVIGLEVHAQLLTETKIFCGCGNSYGEEPNSLTCPVCLGLPGALPVLNRQAVEFAMRLILAVDGKVSQRSVFARKNYFYPDLPKGYQISQFDLPVGQGGGVAISLENGTTKTIELIRAHLEEDAGKSMHPEHGETYSRVDLNRCGTPLIEIVSKPEIHSPEEAYQYLTKLKQILRYTRVCSGDMEKGHLRCDANVSVRPKGSTKFGTRTELKNMNSFKGVERALRFEIDRQATLIRNGGEVEQATLLWDDKRQVAEPMRSKEESHDYRYFPDPDLPVLHVSQEWINEVMKSLPEMPEVRKNRFVEQYQIRLYDAEVLTDTRELAEYYEAVTASYHDAQIASNWVQSELLGFLKERNETIEQSKVKPNQLADLLKKIDNGAISGKMAKTVLAEMVETGKNAEEIIKAKGLSQITDESALLVIVKQVLSQNQKNIEQYKAGQEKVFTFFVGQVMKATKGQASPAVVNKLLKEQLEKY